MVDKQNFNGNRGESRTKAILSEYFYVNERSVDIDGADFIVEIPFNSIQEFRKFKEQGIVQAKYFENQNEVKIAKEYVEDIDTLRTNFFAFLHTNDEDGNKVHYFFSSSQIKKEFRLRKDKKTLKEYYIFSLTKTKTFNNYKNLTDKIISRSIKNGILTTEEYSRQKLIREVEEKHKNPKKPVYENSNFELFKSIKDKHIIDQLYICLNQYKKFRRITSWRLIDKISFSRKINTRTYYNGFKLDTNHEDILTFFSSIEVNEKIKIKDKKFISNVEDAEFKIDNIINTLNNNLIIQVKKGVTNEKIDIQIKKTKVCNCINCSYKKLNFAHIAKTVSKLEADSNNLWESLQQSLGLIRIGDYDKAKILLEDTSLKAKENKEPVIYFVSKHNLRDIAWKKWEDSIPDIELELDKLNISSEHFSILTSINNGKLTNDYANAIDEIYTKIKDYKQRKSVNDTSSLTWKLYYKYGEYVNLMEGNYLTTYKGHNTLTEKVVESFIISHSMNNEFSNHFERFNDFIIESIIHNCEPSNLLKYFQRNKINEIPYKSETNYLNVSLSNFFSSANIDYLQSEIIYVDYKTKNIDLRRTTERIFENLCILLTYVEIDFEKNLLDEIIVFIKKLDFSTHELSILAHPLLKKSDAFKTKQILDLIKTLIEKKLTKGYLITNAIYALNQKKYFFDDQSEDLLIKIIESTIESPEYGTLKALKNSVSKKHKEILDLTIKRSLDNQFNSELFYQAIISESIQITKVYVKEYIKSYEKIINGAPAIVFKNVSPNTGIAHKFRIPLNNLVTIIYKLNDKTILNNSTLKKIKLFDPYYSFILDLDNYTISDKFNINWLLENESKVVLERIAKNNALNVKLKEELSCEYRKDLGKLFINHFTK
ncbi:hypothetical protein Q4566_16210 [Tamlana sp. 2_MG-2023]|uniref:hypothetical protein n=1 Tax=unclassified Tamlana TaxID=2614803 RepID=UPI0026E3336E|nr:MULTISPECIES: hypothetical protein [unclassified Tamlana]MDO6761753.1 hypothetical protein [Tamlana sp. 2_MG-2023]MDO6792514.1 hypothetical protein [Tamlana sp. 1_MG-2023]